jgi:hypothetical protein
VLHDSTTSQEEKNKLAELQHSPRTRRKLTVDAARMTNDPAANDYVQCGFCPSSSAGRRSPPREPYALDIPWLFVVKALDLENSRYASE